MADHVARAFFGTVALSAGLFFVVSAVAVVYDTVGRSPKLTAILFAALAVYVCAGYVVGYAMDNWSDVKHRVRKWSQ